MRPSIKRSLTGILMAGVLASSAVGADARGGGGCSPCYFVGITPAPGGSPEGGGFQGGGFQANTGHGYGHIRRTAKKAMADMALVAAITAGIERAPTALVTG